MQKHSDQQHRSEKGFPLLAVILIGLIFFGIYLAVERLSPDAPTIRIALCFIGAYALISTCIYVIFLLKERRQRGLRNTFESMNAKMHNMFKYVVDFPYAVVDERGHVRAINQALQELIGAKHPFFRGTLADFCEGVTLQKILEIAHNIEKRQNRNLGHLTMELIQEATEAEAGNAADHDDGECEVTVTLRNGRRYVVHAYRMYINESTLNYMVTFTDVTELYAIKDKAERDMPVVALIDVDNLEELTQYTRTNYRDASRKVDDVLIRWAEDVNGFLREYERDRYLLMFSQEKLDWCKNGGFVRLLDDIHNIRLGEYSISVTVSMGVSAVDASMAERAKDAGAALDMAVQRGGDQVALHRRSGVSFYGGILRPFQRRTKVQSRVVANYLLSKISSAKNLLIMGHKNPDFDSIGSCLGIAQMGLLAGVPTKIIIDLNNSNFRTATERLMTSQVYRDMFISGHKGLDLIRPDTLLIVSDANNFSIFESPEVARSVLQISGKIAIIDHHRQTAEYDFEPVMNYIDTTASSASELVAELLEYTDTGVDSENNNLVSDTVASVILSGIVLDTGNYTRNTGSRTLDAARYLLSKGANAEYVHSFFTEDYAGYMCERTFANCSFLQDNTVGLTWSLGTGQATADRIAAAKAAEKLLNVKGVKATFALVVIDDMIHISGRSDGEVNVQLICERLGGGGRYESAGAALKNVTLEEARERLTEAIHAHFADQQSGTDGAANAT